MWCFCYMNNSTDSFQLKVFSRNRSLFQFSGRSRLSWCDSDVQHHPAAGNQTALRINTSSFHFHSFIKGNKWRKCFSEQISTINPQFWWFASYFTLVWSLVLCVKRLNCFSLILLQCVRSEDQCFFRGVKLSNCVWIAAIRTRHHTSEPLNLPHCFPVSHVVFSSVVSTRVSVDVAAAAQNRHFTISLPDFGSYIVFFFDTS